MGSDFSLLLMDRIDYYFVFNKETFNFINNTTENTSFLRRFPFIKRESSLWCSPPETQEIRGSGFQSGTLE